MTSPIFERRSAGDPGIIGQDIYDHATQQLIGQPQLAAPIRDSDGAWMVIVRLPTNNPDDLAHMRLTYVLVKTAEGESGYRVDSPDRHRLQDEADRQGAGWAAREEGVAGDEEALPSVHTPDDPEAQNRPSGGHHDPTATLHPRGKPFGRTYNRDDSTEKSSQQQGGSTMASVGEVKAAIDGAMATAGEAQAIVRAGIEKLNEAQRQLAVALEGGSHDSIAQSQAAIEHAKEQLEGGIQAISGAQEQAQQFAAGL